MKSNTLIWLIVGALALYAVYFMFSKSQTIPMETTQTERIQQVNTPPKASLPMTVTLQTQSGLGQSGTATLTENTSGKLVVKLALTGGTFTGPQPAHIHLGSCPTPGAVKYPLTNVVAGLSETTLPVSWSEIEVAGEYLAINVHKSAAESKVYTACGDLLTIVAGNAGSVAPIKY